MGPGRVTGLQGRGGAITVAALLALAGCSGTDDDGGPPGPLPLEERVSFEEVALPESLRSDSRFVGTWSVTAASGDQPWLAVTTISHGRAAEADVGVWQARGEDSLSEQGEIEVAGDVATAVVASDGTLTAIAGYSVVDGLPRSFLLTSGDRTDWEPVELSPEAGALAVSHVAVSDGRIYLLGGGATGRAPAVAVHDPADGSTTVTPLPEPADGEYVTLAGVAALGERVLVVSRTGPDVTAPQVHVSDDGGGEFTTVEMGGDFHISGVVAADEEFVATGAVDTRGYAKPAAWSSADGRSWQVEDIGSLWEWDPNRWVGDRADVSFSAPSYDPSTGVLAAAIVNEAARGVHAAVRESDRAWYAVLYSGALGFDAHGRATQQGDRTVLLTTFNGGSAKEAFWDIGSGESAGTDLVSYEIEPSRMSALPLGSETAVTVQTRAYIPADSGGWRYTSRAALYTYSAEDGLVAATSGPDDLPEEAEPLASTDTTTGRSVLVTAHWTGERFVTRTWVSEEADAWSAGGTLDTAEFQEPTAIVHTEEGWVLAVWAKDGEGGGRAPRRAEIWSSADGVEWAREPGEFALPEGQESVVHDLCDTPSGALAVGTMEDSDGDSRATAWARRGGVWEPTVVVDSPRSFLSGCVRTEDGVLVFGSDGSASRSWEATGSSTFVDVDALAHGLHRADVVMVPGGYAAGGHVRTPEHVGPVLWLSPDARAWDWVPLPVSTSDSGSGEVAVVGEDLLVLHPGVLRAWRVPDVAAVLDGGGA